MHALLTLFPPNDFGLIALILGMPLLGAFVNGIWGERLGKPAVRFMALVAVGTSFVAGVVAFFALDHEVGASKTTELVAGVQVSHHGHATLAWTAWEWMHTTGGHEIRVPIDLRFSIDALSGVMMLVVTGVGFLIHLYATAYMEKDKAYWRFFAYLNLFIFAMLVLILGDSLPGARVQRGEPLRLNAVFRSGKLQVNSTPSGLPFAADNGFGYVKSGTTPAELTEVPTGGVSIKVTRPGWPDIVQSAQVPADGAQTVFAEFAPGALQVTSTPSGAGVFLQGRQLGVTPLTLPDLVPGSYVLELRLKGYKNANARGEVKSKETALAATTLNESRPESGQPWTIPDLGLAMVPIAPGTFMMGSSTSSESDEKPVTQVTLTKNFWLGKTEVTQREWTAVMGSNPSKFQGENLPVEQVSWDDAMEFCRNLTALERTAHRLPAGMAYTLPTEAQWEYACRAGTTGDYASNLDAMAWYDANSGNQPHAVETKTANAWGVSDMHGNVWEWCADWYADNLPGGSVTDPTGPSSGTYRVNRGGGWNNGAAYCRSAYRNRYVPGNRGVILGFRLALSSVP